MALADRILAELGRNQTAALDDDELAARLGVIRQAVNQTARRLAAQGRLVRDGNGPKITNRLGGTAPPSPPPPPRVASPSGLLAEDEVKAAVRDHLVAEGYEVTVAWGRTRGVDIDARGPAGRLLLEAKGEVALQPQQVNYFVGALGELVQRMADGDARYGLALPDNRQYRGLVSRLPEVAWQRLGLIVFFVGRSPAGCVVTREERG